MQQVTSPKTSQVFDGPFKVPLPKKNTSAFTSVSEGSNKLRTPKPKYKSIDSKFQSIMYQKLLVKMLQNPESMTKYDMKILSAHPIIKRLLKTSKNSSGKNTSFYVPIDSLLNPQLYSNSHIPVIMETETDRQQKNRKDLNRSEEIQDEEMANESTNSSHDSEEVQEEPLVGFYTKKERQQRILKYKQKLQRYRKNKASNQPRNRKN